MQDQCRLISVRCWVGSNRFAGSNLHPIPSFASQFFLYVLQQVSELLLAFNQRYAVIRKWEGH